MADTPVILAIDNGTQSTRVIAFDTLGQLIDKAQVELKNYQQPEKGWMEHDVTGFFVALSEACHKLWQQGHVAPEQISGVVVTTQRATVINLDASGQPLRPAIVWPDQRRAAITSKRPFLWRLVFRLLGLKPTIDALERECEINWLAQNQPEIWQNTAHFVLLSGYLNYRLTGRVADSVGNQVGFIPFDFKTLEWCSDSDWKWSCMPVKREQLPELVGIGEKLGEVTTDAASLTGLLIGTPVFAGAADKACEVLGAGCNSPNIGSISCGTAATVNATSYAYLEPRPFLPPYPAAIPNAFNLEIQIYRGFWMIHWFKEQFGLADVERAKSLGVSAESLFEQLLLETAAGAEGLIMQPYWNPGLGKPGPEARGSLIGFTDTHTRAHVYRAIVEGLAFALREGKEHLENRTKQPMSVLRVSGGGSQSDAVMQILADVMNCPTERPATFEASGLGAAIIGAVSLDIYSNYNAAIDAMTHVRERFIPNTEAAVLYEKLYSQVYSKQYGRLFPLYKKLQNIFS